MMDWLRKVIDADVADNDKRPIKFIQERENVWRVVYDYMEYFACKERTKGIKIVLLATLASVANRLISYVTNSVKYSELESKVVVRWQIEATSDQTS